MQEAFELSPIGKKHLLLVVGGYDSKIHCYTSLRAPFQAKENVNVDGLFSYKFSLTGHMNSLKDFSFSSAKFELPQEVQFLASASQDQNIRLWKIQPLSNVQSEISDAKVDDIEEDIKQYQSKTSYVLDLGDDSEEIYNIALESVLVQHHDAVSSVEWALSDETYYGNQKTAKISDLYLLSSSFDFTVCVWQADEEFNQWSVISTLGAMTGNKHAYFGAMFLDAPASSAQER